MSQLLLLQKHTKEFAYQSDCSKLIKTHSKVLETSSFSFSCFFWFFVCKESLPKVSQLDQGQVFNHLLVIVLLKLNLGFLVKSVLCVQLWSGTYFGDWHQREFIARYSFYALSKFLPKCLGWFHVLKIGSLSLSSEWYLHSHKSLFTHLCLKDRLIFKPH